MIYSKPNKGKKSTSTIDYAISNNASLHVDNPQVNQNERYESHKPIICKLKINKINISEIEPIYNFSPVQFTYPKLPQENENISTQ